jgi:hypothetical protein
VFLSAPARPACATLPDEVTKVNGGVRLRRPGDIYPLLV